MLDIVPGLLNYPHFKKFLFLFLFSLGDFHYSFFQLADPFLCILKSTLDSFKCIYLFQLLYSSASFGSFFNFFNSLLKFSLCSSVLLLSLLSIFKITTLNYLSVGCLFPLHLALLLGIYLVFSFGTYSSVPSFC